MTQHGEQLVLQHPGVEDPPTTASSTVTASTPGPLGGLRTAAVVAGAALTSMAALGGFGNFVVVEGLVTAGDAAATARDIAASDGLFRLGVASLYLVVVLDVVAAWALMRVFSPVHAELSRLDAWLRLSYAAVFMVAVSQLAGIPALLSSDAGGSTAPQLQAQALAKVETFHDVWFAGLVLFGAHLMIAGHLAYRSGYVPRPIGVLLVVAGAGYTVDSFVDLFVDDVAFTVSSATFLGEFLLALWLLFRGRRIAVPSPSPDTIRGSLRLP